MSNDEIIYLSDDTYEHIKDINQDELPDIITSHLEGLKELSTKADTALGAAKTASEKVENSKFGTTGFGIFTDDKKNFETLKDAQNEIAKATIAVSDGLKVAYKNQEALAKVSKYLFTLGCSSIATSRIVVKQLEIELSGASPDKLSDFAKSELYSVIRQLKAQEDIFEKLEHLKENEKSILKKIEKHSSEIQQILYGLVEARGKFDWSDKRFSDIETAVATCFEKNAEEFREVAGIKEVTDARIGLLEERVSETKRHLSLFGIKILFTYVVGGLGLLFGISALFFHF